MLTHLNDSRRMFTDQGLGDQERDLGQRPSIQISSKIALCEIKPGVILPALEIDKRIEIFRGSASTNSKVVALPAYFLGIQQIHNDRPIQAATVDGIGSVAAGSSCHEGHAVGSGGSKQRTEVVATQGEMVGQRIVIGEVGAVIVNERGRAVGGIETIHLPVIPFTVNGLPAMRGIQRKRQSIMMGSDGTSVPIGLELVCRNAEWTCPGIVAKVSVEGVILLAYHQAMVDQVGSALGHRCPHPHYRD